MKYTFVKIITLVHLHWVPSEVLQQPFRPSGAASSPDQWEKLCSSREVLCWKHGSGIP